MENAIWIEAADGARYFNVDYILGVEDEETHGIAEAENVDGQQVVGRITLEEMNKVRKYNPNLIRPSFRKRQRLLRNQKSKEALFKWLKPHGGCS